MNSRGNAFISAKGDRLPFIWMASIGLSLTGLVYFASATFFSDSEIWPLSLSTHIWTEILRSSVHLKFTTHFLLWISSLPATSDLEVYFWARMLFALNGVAICGLAFQITDLVFSRRAAWCSTLLLALSPTFTNQIFRIRADCISVTFFLLVIFISVKAHLRAQPRFPRLAYGAALTMVLATPKSVYFLLALLPVWRLFPKRARLRARAWGFSLGIVGLLLATVYHEAINHFLAHFRETVAIPKYFSLFSFVYFFRVIQVDALIALGLVIYFLWPQQQTPLQKSLRLVMLITLTTVILHNEKLPFFLGSRIPIFAMGAGVAVDRLLTLLKPTLRFWAQIALPVLLFSYFCKFHAASDLTNSNKEQQVAILNLGELMGKQYPNTRYWDAIGILPLQQPLFHFLGPGRLESNRSSLAYAQREAPEFVFLTNKFEFVLPETLAWLATDYVALGQGIYGKSVKAWDAKTDHQNLVLDASEIFAKLKSLDPEAKSGLLTLQSEPSKLVLVIVTFRDGHQEFHHNGEHRIVVDSSLSSIRVHGRVTDARLTPYYLRMPSQWYTAERSMSDLFRFDPHAL